jgi:hypothetical protein
METIDNIRFLALHSAFPWLTAAFFASLGLWFGHVLWFDWVRQLRPLRAEHRELSRRLEGLTAVRDSSPPPVSLPEPSPAAAAPELFAGALSAEFWPIPERAPEATVVTGEVVPDKVREAAARLVGIPLGPDSPGGGKEA